MKKQIIFTLTIVFCLHYSASSQLQSDSNQISQEFLIGIWQINTDVISSSLHKTIQFFADKKFVYTMDKYNDLNPIISISGKYKTESGGLSLLIEEITQLSGYKIEEADHGFQFGLFQLSGGKTVVIKQKDSEFTFHELKKIYAGSKKGSVIMIDNEKYFKFSDNPHKYMSKLK
jgi:hypothetical protein